jgi:hypothetical protein
MKLRLSIVIPGLLILSSLIGDTLLFRDEVRSATRNIEQEALGNTDITLTQLRNVLTTQLATDNREYGPYCSPTAGIRAGGYCRVGRKSLPRCRRPCRTVSCIWS